MRSIDDYLAGLDPEARVALEKVRRAIRSAAPDAEECFGYGMPAFRLNGKLVAGYETSKGAVRFQPDRILPAALIRTLVRARIAEIAGEAESAGEIVLKAIYPSRKATGRSRRRRRDDETP